MAFQVVTTLANQLEKQRIGFIGLSIDEWDTGNEPEVQSGSKIEISGSLYEFTAAEDVDPDGNWAGIGNSTIVYGYCDANNLKLVLTTTAPTWIDTKNGYYDATETYRYYMRLYKDAAGDYTQKAIYLNRYMLLTYQGIQLSEGANADALIRFATDASILWDEGNDEFVIDKNLNPSDLSVNLLNFPSFAAGSEAMLAFATWTPDAGLYMMVFTTNFLELQIFVNGSWRTANDAGPGLIWCDGANVRVNNSDGAGHTVYYYKLTT